MAPIARGNSLYAIVDGPSWTQAEANAVKLGGHLAAINSGEENIFLFENYGIGSNGRTISSGYWIGLTKTNEWKWSNGEQLLWHPDHWFRGEPNGNGNYVWIKAGFDYPNMTYAQYLSVVNTAWTTDPNNRGAKTYATNGGPDWDDTGLSGERTNYGVAEIPFVQRGDSAYVIVEGPTWEAAEANAVKLGGHLVTVNDEAESTWLGNEFSQAKYRYDADNSPWAPNEWTINHFWVGGKKNGAQWSWASGETFDNTLSSLYLNNSSDSASTRLLGIFNNPNHRTNIYLDDYRDQYPTNPSLPYKGIVEIKLTPSTPTPTHSLSPSATSINEGSALTTTVSTTNVASGTTLYYSLSGTGITTADFSSGSLTGSGTVSSSGSFSFSHTLANDLTTEGTETLEIKLFTDSSRSTQVASTSVSINDTSLTPTSNVTVNGNNNGIANAGTINNNGTINTGTINTNSGNTTNNITNTTVNNTNITYNYYTNTTNNVNSNNTTTNVSSNNTLNTWNIFRVDATVKVAEIVNQWFGTAAPTSKQSQDVTDTKLLDINASTWSDKIQINRVAKATDNGDILEALMPELGGDPRVGSVLNGGAGRDVISGRAGWDVLDGGDADDLIHGGNGRDIITGGAGRDELHGDFGWNTYKSEKDGVSDLIAIKSDQYLSNWIYGKAGNNADGSKCDIIEGLDAVDRIKIIGVDTRDITFAANVTAKGLTGIGIYGKGALEALYTGGDLTINQITQMTSGDASAAAMANQINSYGTW